MDARRRTFEIILTALLLALLLAWIAVVGPALSRAEALDRPASGALGLVIQKIDVTRYPTVSMRVLVPPRMASERPLAAGDVRVTEGGAPTTGLTLRALTGRSSPVSTILLMDTSGSMRGSPMSNAKKAANTFVKAMRTGDRVAVVAFATKPVTVAGITKDRRRLTRAIGSLQPSGQTAIYDALLAATRLLRRPGKESTAIVLLSDGQDTSSERSLQDALKAVRKLGTPVYAIGLGAAGRESASLELVARSSRGRLLAVSDPRALVGLYADIARELKSQYDISFLSARPRTKDIEIDIVARRGGLTASAGAVIANPSFGSAASPFGLLSRGSPALSGGPAAVVVVGLVFAAVVLLSYGVGASLVRERTGIDQLPYYDGVSPGAGGDIDGAGAGTQTAQVKARMLEAFDSVAGRGGFTKAIGDKLEKAGLPLRPLEYMLAHVIGVAAFAAVLVLATRSPWVSVVASCVAALGPVAALEILASRRHQAFQDQLPDILDFIAGSLKAGYGLLQAVNLVVEDSQPPVSTEFKRVRTEARLGLSLEEALSKMADRLDSEDFRWVVAAISVQREAGGNLAEVLNIIGNTIRDRAATARSIRALTADGRLSAIILIILPFAEALVLFTVNPAYMSRLISDPLGPWLIGAALTLLLIGGLWLRRAVRIEV
jgi:tight adherence protein B